MEIIQGTIPDGFSWTPLMYAVKYCDSEIGIKIIESIINSSNNDGNYINKKNTEGDTALIIAIKDCKTNYREKIIKLLLSIPGIDVNAKNKYMSVLMYAIKNCIENILDDIPLIKLLIEREDININDKTKDGWNAISYISRYCKTEYSNQTLKLLLSYYSEGGKNIDINIQDNNGFTPLMFAVTNCKHDSNEYTVELLLSYYPKGGKENRKIDINIQDNNGNTALIYAIQYCKTSSTKSVVKLLLSIPNININLQNKYGWNALIYAIIYTDEEIVQLLLDKGAILNKQIIKDTIIIEPEDKYKLYEFYIDNLESRIESMKILKPIHTEDDVVKSIVLNYL